MQNRIRERTGDVARLLRDANRYVYICGLKGMEEGVDAAFRNACRSHDMDWDPLRAELRKQGRYDIETD